MFGVGETAQDLFFVSGWNSLSPGIDTVQFKADFPCRRVVVPPPLLRGFVRDRCSWWSSVCPPAYLEILMLILSHAYYSGSLIKMTLIVHSQYKVVSHNSCVSAAEAAHCIHTDWTAPSTCMGATLTSPNFTQGISATSHRGHREVPLAVAGRRAKAQPSQKPAAKVTSEIGPKSGILFTFTPWAAACDRY